MDHCFSQNKHLASDTALEALVLDWTHTTLDTYSGLLVKVKSVRNRSISSNLKMFRQKPDEARATDTSHKAGNCNNKCSQGNNSKQTFNGLKCQHKTHITHRSVHCCYNNKFYRTKECHNNNI